MNDQISRQKLIEELEECSMIAIRNEFEAGGEWEDYVKLDTVRELVESQPPADQWIPCSERLPRFLQPCFITVQHSGLITTFRAVYWESHWSTENENFNLENVTAWMPAEPYKGE